MKRKTKEQKGVTLVALVVTIVILLILVAIGISTLTGDNGLITKAKEASQKTEEANEKENQTLQEIENIIEDKTEGTNWKGELNHDTNGDGKPDINIDTDGDGKPDINIDTTGDKKPNVNVDTTGDGKPNINIDTDGDYKPNTNIDTNGDGKADVNIDTNGDGKPDLNIDTDKDGIPDLNVDTDGDGEPDIDIDTNGDGKPDINLSALQITTNPTNIETIAGRKDVTFQIEVTGEGEIIYQWYYATNNSTENGIPIEGATSPIYTIPANQITTSLSGRYYYCVITQNYRNKETRKTTEAATLTVASPLTITTQPIAKQVIRGKTAVTFNTTGIGTGNISYQWYYNTSNSTEGGQVIQGVTQNSYTIAAENITTDLNGRYYYCEITQTYGNATVTVKTNTALLSVVAPVAITTQPAAVTVTPGNNAIFAVTTTGTGSLSYQWYQNNTNSTTGGNIISGATNASYTLNAASSSDNGKYYYCIVTQSYGSSTANVTSSTALLTVGNKVSVSKPSDVSVIAGKTAATYTVTATGSGTFAYQWYKNSTNSNSGGSAISGATGASYTIAANNVTTSLNGKYYYCVVTQTYGSSTEVVSSNAAKLNVVAATIITKNPSEISVIAGKTAVTYTVEASGEGTKTYQWYQNSSNSNSGGTVIAGATGASYTIAAGNVGTSLNGKYYYCVVTQKYGSSTAIATSNAAKLNVVAATAITKHPNEVSVIAGKTSVTYSITASGTGLSYQWYQNSTNSNSGGSAISGATGASYTIAAGNVGTSLNGKYYYCVVTQTYGSSTGAVSSNAAKLNVVAATTITKNPSEVSVIAGKTTVTYSVTASGTGLSYQWYQNSSNSNSGGTAISGATGATYSIDAASVTTSLSGKYYYCVVSQNYGSSSSQATSNAAKLNVVSVATITKQPIPLTVVTTTGAAFSIEASGNGTLSYQWYYNTSNSTTGGSAISGINSNIFSMSPGMITADLNGRYYYCVVTQTYGSSTATITSNAALLTVKAYASDLRQGDYVNYVDKNGTTRKSVVLHDSTSSYGTQIITTTTVEDVQIGNGTGSSKTDTSSYATATASHENAITTLNTKARAYLNTSYASAARSVGSDPKSPDTVDDASDIDSNKMKALNIKVANKSYWLAAINNPSSFWGWAGTVYYINISSPNYASEATIYSYQRATTEFEDEINNSYSVTYGLRPVFTLKNTVKILGGSGTEGSPYVLGL